ncbi:hypothetical protein KEM56_006275 [Ascosphaera pollenicola]|nr:hypothetical protein KEM56_006275 [Ascosphaera pollenicola]
MAQKQPEPKAKSAKSIVPKMPTPTFSERVQALTDPFKFLAIGVYCFFSVLYNALFVERNYKSIADVKDKAFSKLWNEFLCPPSTQPSVAPLTGSASLPPPLLARATGIVLDIGPGNGTLVRYFTNPAVEAVYGIEPCVPLHAELQKQVAASPVAGKYHVIEASAESRSLYKQLRKHNLLPKGSTTAVFDTICCVRCLCSVSDPEKVVAGLYPLLKPGGKLLVVEHVTNPWTAPQGSIIARLVQIICQNLGFSFFIGNCHLNRDTSRIIDMTAIGDGGWERVELETLFGHSPFAHISASFTKRHGEKN